LHWWSLILKAFATDSIFSRDNYYIERDGQIFLLMMFNKNEQDNLTEKQKKTLSNLIRELREEGQ
jgi:hypothetical protein